MLIDPLEHYIIFCSYYDINKSVKNAIKIKNKNFLILLITHKSMNKSML